jgi:hypothetical protein
MVLPIWMENLVTVEPCIMVRKPFVRLFEVVKNNLR